MLFNFFLFHFIFHFVNIFYLFIFLFHFLILCKEGVTEDKIKSNILSQFNYFSKSRTRRRKHNNNNVSGLMPAALLRIQPRHELLQVEGSKQARKEKSWQGKEKEKREKEKREKEKREKGK
jgi:hypothetical protein